MERSDKQFLIIAGVNKAGTTSLFMYLSIHPEICPSRVKETQYFLPLRYGIEELEPINKYLDYFSHCNQARYFLEATPGYYYGGRRVAQTIKNMLGPTRIILMFRDPIDRMFSFFKFRKSMLELDRSLTFDQYIILCESLPPVERIKRENNAFWGIEGGFYSKYLLDWLDVFGEDQVRIFFFENFIKDPKSVLLSICHWLDIEYDKYLRELILSVENRTINYKNYYIQKLALILNWQLEAFWRQHPHIKRTLRKMYYFFNGSKSDDSISPEARKHLEAVFHPYNKDLVKVLIKFGIRDLPDWLENELIHESMN